MTYKQTLTALCIVLSAVGISVILVPATISGMMGAPIEAALSSACETFEVAKQDLVRLVGAHTLSIGMLCWFLRRLEDPAHQGWILKGMTVSCIPGLLAGTASSLGWLPMSVSVIALSVLLAGLYGHTQAAKN